MKVVAIIQARVSSSRLPAKSLLPVAGLPLALLCAKRAGNRGLPVRVATSDHQSDNALFRVFQEHNIECARGPLDDVLRRFVIATADLQFDDIVVRLTSDNVIPDGGFLDGLIQQFRRSNLGYMGTSYPEDGLPYGVSAEIFTVNLLREADCRTVDGVDREHVTPWIRREAETGRFSFPTTRDLSYLRATVDTFQDYQQVWRLFDGETDPINVSWLSLCQRLESDSGSGFRIPYRIKHNHVVSRMTLGTAQLGLERYGIANDDGRPNGLVAAEIISRAVRHGVTVIDTARAYNEAETRIGQAFEVLPRDMTLTVTKLDPMAGLEEATSRDSIRAAVERSIFCSCHNLRSRRLDVVMLHRSQHYRLCGGAIWQTLLDCRKRGLIRELGVSVYTPEEAMSVLHDPDVLHLQIPLNCLDRRWKQAGIQESLQARPDIIVYARSLFLQGALLLPPEKWPRPARSSARKYCTQLDRLAEEFGRESRTDLAIGYVLAQPWIDTVVLGVDNLRQLDANLLAVTHAPLTEEQVSRVEAVFADIPEDLLNPVTWNTIDQVHDG